MLIRIVDDDEDLAESLKFLLEPEGWEVVSYPSAEDYLKSDAPSVEGCLLLDIRMPGLSGLELQEKMKERGWEVPIIFLTGHGDVDVAVQAMKFGAYDFLQAIDPVVSLMISFKNLSKPSDSSKPFPALPQCSRRSGITVQVWNIGTRNSSCSPTANGASRYWRLKAS